MGIGSGRTTAAGLAMYVTNKASYTYTSQHMFDHLQHCLNGMLFVKFHSQLIQDIRVQYSMIYLKAKLSSIIINVLHVCITEVTVCICVCGTSYPVCVD